MARALSRTLALLGVGMLLPGIAFAQEIPRVNVSIGGARGPHDVAATLQIILLLTVLSLAPAILLTLTSFVRVVIVLAFTRSALGIQQVPPNQVIIGLALFLTFFLMQPVWKEINSQALQPYLAHDLLDEAVKRGEGGARFPRAQTGPRIWGCSCAWGAWSSREREPMCQRTCWRPHS